MPTKCRQQFSYALHPLNYLPSSPRLITKQLNYSRATPVTEMIKLENVFMRDTGIIDFTLHVSNICYSKKIFLRYSIDGWKTFADIECFYKKASIPSTDYFYGVDEFSAMLDSHKLMKEQQDYSQMEFAICYQYDHNTVWNNNGGMNYTMAVHVKATDLEDVLESDSEYSDNKSESMKSLTSLNSTESIHLRPYSVAEAWNVQRKVPHLSKPFRQRYSFEQSEGNNNYSQQQAKSTLSPQQRPNSHLFKATPIHPMSQIPVYKEFVDLGTSPPAMNSSHSF
jgi:hypothetical protein